MKTKFQPLCIFLLALATFLTGCATTDNYRLNQTRTDIDSAMKRYQNEVAFGSIAPPFQPQVTAAYQAYKTAFDEAVQQAHSNYNAPTPANVKQLADQLLSILGSIPVVH